MSETLFQCLKAYEGHEVEIVRWLHEFGDLHQQPDRARILKDYENTILLELEKGKAKRKTMIMKAAMVCSDVILKDKETGERLTGQKIARKKQ